jgi:hypothetical protein
MSEDLSAQRVEICGGSSYGWQSILLPLEISSNACVGVLQPLNRYWELDRPSRTSLDWEAGDTEMAFEPVYTVWNYFDGPRSGIAAYSGQPHHYDCEWNEIADDYADTFVLNRIDEETLSLALEQWSIWREWEAAFHRGKVSQATDPALPGQHSRYAELEVLVKGRTSDSATQRIRARGLFRARQGQADAPRGVMRELEVEWIEATETT